jgi:hypothetical protein
MNIDLEKAKVNAKRNWAGIAFLLALFSGISITLAYLNWTKPDVPIAIKIGVNIIWFLIMIPRIADGIVRYLKDDTE